MNRRCYYAGYFKPHKCTQIFRQKNRAGKTETDFAGGFCRAERQKYAAVGISNRAEQGNTGKNGDIFTVCRTDRQSRSRYARMRLGMLVCADTNCNPFIDYCEQDCAAATENMLIAAKKLGIGSCWIGVYPNSERVEPIRQYFSLPQNIVPLWMIAFGYPAETPKVKNKWNDAKIHYEKF